MPQIGLNSNLKSNLKPPKKNSIHAMKTKRQSSLYNDLKTTPSNEKKQEYLKKINYTQKGKFNYFYYNYLFLILIFKYFFIQILIFISSSFRYPGNFQEHFIKLKLEAFLFNERIYLERLAAELVIRYTLKREGG